MTAKDGKYYQQIVVFETNDFDEDDPAPELDLRGIRDALPSGVSPLAMATHHGFAVHCGQHFFADEVAAFAEKHSGFKAGEEVH